MRELMRVVREYAPLTVAIVALAIGTGVHFWFFGFASSSRPPVQVAGKAERTLAAVSHKAEPRPYPGNLPEGLTPAQLPAKEPSPPSVAEQQEPTVPPDQAGKREVLAKEASPSLVAPSQRPEVPPEVIKKELDKLQGMWLLVSYPEPDKEPGQAEHYCLLLGVEVKGDTIRILSHTWFFGEKREEVQGKLRINPILVPATLDLAFPEKSAKPENILGIYKFDNGWLYVELGSSEKRPNDFATEPSYEHCLLKLGRIEPAVFVKLQGMTQRGVHDFLKGAQRADGELKRLFSDGGGKVRAQTELERIIKIYPETPAAQEAKKLLSESDEKLWQRLEQRQKEKNASELLQKAERRLDLAVRFGDTVSQKRATENLQDIIKNYPGTKAAEEAKTVLEKLKP